MRRGWKVAGSVLAVIAAAGWYVQSNYDQWFVFGKLRGPFATTLPTGGSPAQFRNEFISREGALCGEVRNIDGGERYVVAGSADITGGRIVPIAAASWRRYIIVPSVPAFYVSGLKPWGLALNGRRIDVDTLDIDNETALYNWQYAQAAAIDSHIDPQAAKREIAAKVNDEHFEISWAEYCDAPRAD